MKRLTKGRCSDPCEVMFWYVLLCFSQNDNKLKELTIARFTEDLESTQGRLAEFNALQKSEFQLRMELDAMKNKEVNNKIDLQLYSFVSIFSRLLLRNNNFTTVLQIRVSMNVVIMHRIFNSKLAQHF